MRTTVVCLLLLLAVSSIVLTLPPSALSETENVKILNYTYRFNPSGILVATGEIQNTGSTILSTVIISGTATPGYGNEVLSGDLAWARNLLPGQKAPFYMEFRTNTTSNGAWVGGLSDVTFRIIQASPVSEYQYQGVTITEHQPSQSSGEYSISGELKNTGAQTATNVAVIATFYNSEGKPIAAGSSSQIATMASEGINEFSVSAYNLNQTYATSEDKISSYVLMVQVESPLLNETPIPSPTWVASSSGQSNTSNTANNLSPIYIVAFAVVIAVVVAVLILLTRRKPVKLSSSKLAHSERQGQGRKRRKR